MMIRRLNKSALFLIAALTLSPGVALAKASIDYPIVKLRSLDKVTARTEVFEANVGRTIKFGSVYIKVQACRKAPELEKPEAGAFLQVWETPSAAEGQESKPEWIFSGWMFASSPGLSAMDHPIYDVWVLDCLQTEAERNKAAQESETASDIREGEGVLSEEVAPSEPAIAQ